MTASNEPVPTSSRPSKMNGWDADPHSFISDWVFVAVVYLITLVVAGLTTLNFCGPGCCFLFYCVIAAVSGLLMLRRSFTCRVFCFIVLLLSLAGMWHEKEVRDSWDVHALKQQIQDMQQAQANNPR